MTGPPAIAVFVKTPGRSPVKTRLAASVGIDAAERFYRLCVAAAGAAVADAADRFGLAAYWAVAESEAVGDAVWTASGFGRVAQGTGGLGERLDRVYRTLCERHPVVLLVGADAPRLSADLIRAAVAAAGRPETPFALSRSSDGGYALFAGRRPLPRDVWTTVSYSCDRTAAEFVARLRPFGGVAELDPLDDIDTLDDLAALVAADVTGSPELAAVIRAARVLVDAQDG